MAGPPGAGPGPGEKNFRPSHPSSKGGMAKNRYTKSERLTVSRRVNLAWTESANFYNRQILPRRTKT